MRSARRLRRLLSQAAAQPSHCRPRAKLKSPLYQCFGRSAAVAARQIQSAETMHPAKLSASAAAWQQSVNHSEPNVTSKGNEGSRGAGFPLRRRRADRTGARGRMASKPKKVEAEEVETDIEAEEGAEAAAPSKSWLSRKTIIIACCGALVLIGGGAGAYVLLSGPKETKPVALQAKPAVFIDVPEVLVNLSTTGNERTQYLKVKVVLELPDATLTPQIQTTMPRVMDAFQTYLRELRPTDLDGSAGLYRLKEELTRRVNAAIAPSRINAVLFKEIVVQ